MEGLTASSVFPYLRSCERETDTPIEGELKGIIPKWLKGYLIRIGSGLLHVGPDRYNHVFDGLALMHRFSFVDGKVTYQSKFLKSDTYRRNMKAKRIVVNEFATPGIPDPCKTIFQRFSSLFSLDELTDNDLVNIILYADEAYACSETNAIWKIDPETLDSIGKVKLSKFIPVNAAIAHAHEDTDGTVYNIGSTYGFKCTFKVLKFPPKENKNDSPFKNASIICSIPSSRYLNVSYHHSFGITENYFVLVEQPLYLFIPQMAWVHFFGGGSYADALYWDENRPSQFHVIRRSDGKVLATKYFAKSFFVFHHINAYEEDDHLVVDMCTYDKGDIVKALYVKSLEDLFNNSPVKSMEEFQSRAKRFVLPLNVSDKKKSDNLVELKYSSATAHLSDDGSIYCTPEILADKWAPELPRINYEKFNGKNYKFFYAMAKNENSSRTQLIKLDVENKNVLSWNEEDVIPSEPVFISEPDSINEDSGVLLASLLYTSNESKVSLIVLDAKTMKEVGRVTFSTKSPVPADFHGTFIKN